MMAIDTDNRKLLGVIAFVVATLLAPYVFYPVFLMKVMCFGLFARS